MDPHIAGKRQNQPATRGRHRMDNPNGSSTMARLPIHHAGSQLLPFPDRSSPSMDRGQRPLFRSQGSKHQVAARALSRSLALSAMVPSLPLSFARTFYKTWFMISLSPGGLASRLHTAKSFSDSLDTVLRWSGAPNHASTDIPRPTFMAALADRRTDRRTEGVVTN